MDTAINLRAPKRETLPFVTRFRRLQAQMDGERPLKRFVIFSLKGKMLIATHSYHLRWMAERKARSLRFYGVTGGTVVLDQEDFAGPIYQDEAMVLEDFLELMELD